MSVTDYIWKQIEENIKKDLVKMDGYLRELRYKYNEYLGDTGEQQDFIEYFIESYYIDDLNENQILYENVIDRLTMNINYNIIFEHYKDNIQEIIKKYFNEEEYDIIKNDVGEQSYKY